jgi:4-amino-4-deoxy-L-arabinose transferase-like glycosyltransferase
MTGLQQVQQATTIARSRPREQLMLLILVPFVGFLSLANLATYPTISGWDEGTYLQFGSNLARYGEYGTCNGDTFERLIPAGGTGPTLIVPVALALQLSSHSLVAARLVVVIYFLIAVVGVYVLMRQIGGWPAAGVGVLLFIVAGDSTYDMLWASRQVLAEAPAFAFLMFGLWTWIKSWHGNRTWLIASGILIALAVITKNQLLWVIGPGFALTIIIDRLYFHQLNWAHSLVPLGGAILGYGVWYVVALWIVGPTAQTSYLEALSALAAATYLHGNVGRWFYNLQEFFEHPQSWVAMVAIVYGLYRGRERSAASLARVALPIFASVGVAGFILQAIAFPRYELLPLAFALLSCALLIDDLAGWAARRWRSNVPWRVIVIALLTAALAGPRIVQNVQRILTTNDTSAEQFAIQLDNTVPPDAEVLNWEWEIEFYSRSKFVHPPFRLFPALLDALDQRYDPILDQPCIPSGTKYLVVGPFGHPVFDSTLEQRRHRLLVNEGPYYLYQFY